LTDFCYFFGYAQDEGAETNPTGFINFNKEDNVSDETKARFYEYRKLNADTLSKLGKPKD